VAHAAQKGISAAQFWIEARWIFYNLSVFPYLWPKTSIFLEMQPRDRFGLATPDLNIKKATKKIAGVFEPIPSEYLFTTQKSLSERDLITFLLSLEFSEEKAFAQSFGIREGTILRTLIPISLL
jgi:hypothetical protein